ncbi:hypothetical protein AALB39_04455 [Lachnospiraceae bacterium 54-53]
MYQNNILELSKRAVRGGKVPIKIALLKIHENATDTNKNGIHWNEEYVLNAANNSGSIPICSQFLDETKSTPYGHGYTNDLVNEDGSKEPVFENSEVTGSLEKYSIEEIIDGDKTIKVLAGEGFLFHSRYPNFVKWVRQNYALDKVDSSIEIMGLETNQNKIVYEEDKPTDQFRTPKEFILSGTAILSVSPADDDAIVLEVAEKRKKEEQKVMEFDMNEVKNVIRDTISETNTKNAEFETKISELNELVIAKENTIVELNATVEQVQAALDQLKKDHDTYWAEREILEKELATLKAEKRISELNEAISVYTDEEKKFAESEINSFNEDPAKGDIEGIKAKICVGIVAAQKEQEKVSEVNSKKDTTTTEDIFSEVCTYSDTDEEDVNIF